VAPRGPYHALEESDQVAGFLVVQTPLVAARSYANHYEDVSWKRAHYFRGAFPAFAPERYRGISRYPLERGESGYPWAEARAEEFIERTLGPDPTLVSCIRFDAALLPTLDMVLRVRALLERPEEWETIHVARGVDESTERTLGFDVGYWGSSHFSLVCDCAVMPTWHPPPPEDHEAVRERLASLNRHVLFDTAAEARAFREWYLDRPWGETEDFVDQFQVIRVDRADAG
jgi:hypothetical protein